MTDTDTSEKPYKNQETWKRGVYILIFLFLLGVAKFVAFIVIFFQFLTVLITSDKNEHLLKFGKSLSVYHYQVVLFLTYNSDTHPFPMSDWPDTLDIEDELSSPS